MHTKPIRHSRCQLAYWCFLFVLGFPIAYALLTFDRHFPAPQSLGDAMFFPREFKYYVASDFKPRATLASWHGSLQRTLNGPNQAGRTTIIGQNGFLFSYLLQGQDTLRPSMNYGTIPDLTLTYDTLRRTTMRLQARHEFCRKHNVHYVPLIIALKPLLLPEHLPAEFRLPSPSSLHSPLFRHLRAKAPELTAVDTLSAFRAARERAPVYYQTDSHWTDYGAYVGAQEVVRLLRPIYPRLPEPYSEATRVEHRDAPAGNEARALGLGKQLSDQHVLLRYESPRALERTGSVDTAITELRQSGSRTFFKNPQGELDSLMVFHNSFGIALMPHLARYFRQSDFVWTDFAPELVSQRQPTVVIELILTY